VNRIRHRTWLNRRGVTVPYRVLQDSEVAGVLGCPLPVRPQRPLNAWPCRCSFLRPRPKMRLLGQSSPGVRLSYTVCPEDSATGLSTGGTSLGVLRPFNARGGESSRPTGCPIDPPVLPGSYQRVPPRRLRCRSQVFSTSQRLFPLPTAPPFSGGWRSWGSPYRGLFLPRSPDDSSPPDCPLDVAPASCASPFLGGVLVGAAEVT
jgi:hypothetical protein